MSVAESDYFERDAGVAAPVSEEELTLTLTTERLVEWISAYGKVAPDLSTKLFCHATELRLSALQEEVKKLRSAKVDGIYAAAEYADRIGGYAGESIAQGLRDLAIETQCAAITQHSE